MNLKSIFIIYQKCRIYIWLCCCRIFHSYYCDLLFCLRSHFCHTLTSFTSANAYDLYKILWKIFVFVKWQIPMCAMCIYRIVFHWSCLIASIFHEYITSSFDFFHLRTDIGDAHFSRRVCLAHRRCFLPLRHYISSKSSTNAKILFFFIFLLTSKLNTHIGDIDSVCIEPSVHNKINIIFSYMYSRPVCFSFSI